MPFQKKKKTHTPSSLMISSIFVFVRIWLLLVTRAVIITSNAMRHIEVKRSFIQFTEKGRSEVSYSIPKMKK